jgi:hypothetical protein
MDIRLTGKALRRTIDLPETSVSFRASTVCSSKALLAMQIVGKINSTSMKTMQADLIFPDWFKKDMNIILPVCAMVKV